MRVVAALGGNALLKRGEPMTAENQRMNVRIASQALAPIAMEHELIVSHGNGPQVGLLALQAQAYTEVEAYPLDILGAQTEGMIGYLIEQELGNLLPFEKQLATILTMTEVYADDPAFADPSKFVGPIYDKDQADALAAAKGWVFKADGEHWRRVVASPRPQRIFEIEPIESLLASGAVVICTGGGGIPTMYKTGTRVLQGVEAVVDKDLASAVLAENLKADLFVIATDAPAICLDWGTPQQREIAAVTPGKLAEYSFPAGSMGPKASAAIDFATRSNGRAVIGNLTDIEAMVQNKAGTIVTRSLPSPITFRE